MRCNEAPRDATTEVCVERCVVVHKEWPTARVYRGLSVSPPEKTHALFCMRARAAAIPGPTLVPAVKLQFCAYIICRQKKRKKKESRLNNIGLVTIPDQLLTETTKKELTVRTANRPWTFLVRRSGRRGGRPPARSRCSCPQT